MSGKSLGFIIIAVVFFLPDVFFYFIYNKTEGTVTRINNGKFVGIKGQNAEYNFPTVRFLKNDSVCYYDYQNILFSSPKVGDKITVIYSNDLQNVYLNLPGSFWFSLQKMLLFFLSLIAWIGVANIIWMKKKGAKKKAGIKNQ